MINTPQKQAEIDLLREMVEFHLRWITYFTAVLADPAEAPTEPMLQRQVHAELRHHRSQFIRYASLLEIENRFADAEV